MPQLILGTEKTATFLHILDTIPESEPYLLIDDGPVIDAHLLPTKRREKSYRPKTTKLDLDTHMLNPLDGMTYLKARQFIQVLDSVFPEGQDTLTRKSSNHIILKALLRARKPYLRNLIWWPADEKPTPGQLDAYQKIETILLSPVLKHVLDNKTNLSLTGTIIARLDRATLGDFDAFILGNLLISAYKGTMVIPDFPFYAMGSHSQLIRQGRLIAGVNTLSELDRLPILRDQLLLTEQTRPFQHGKFETLTHHGCHTTARDAEILAEYAHLRPDPTKADNPYNAFIEACMA